MPKPINIVLTIMDGKTPKPNYTQLLINVESLDIIPDILGQMEMARRFQLDIDPLTTAQIVSCGVIVDVPLDPTIKTAPSPDADSEQGMTFVFRSDTGFPTQFRIPSFDESFVVTGYPDVDLTAQPIIDLIENIIAGYNTLPDGTGTVGKVVDSRGDDIDTFLRGLESFQKSRV